MFKFILVAVICHLGAMLVILFGQEVILRKTGRFPGALDLRFGHPVLLDTALRSYTGVAMNKNIDSLEDEIFSQDLPPFYLQALLLQEDAEFFGHKGFSSRETILSIYEYLFRNKKLRGASTITQQLARSLFNMYERTAFRKIIELRIGRKLEEKFSKIEILEMYVSVVYLGFPKRGLGVASQRLFGKPIHQISLEQATFLIALLPKPGACQRLEGCQDPGVVFRTKRLVRLLIKLRQN